MYYGDRDVGHDIEKAFADGVDLREYFEGQTPMFRFKVEKEGNEVKVVGGELGGDDSHVVVSERGVTKTYGDEIIGYAFDLEPRAALVEFFASYYFTRVKRLRTRGSASLPLCGRIWQNRLTCFATNERNKR